MGLQSPLHAGPVTAEVEEEEGLLRLVAGGEECASDAAAATDCGEEKSNERIWGEMREKQRSLASMESVQAGKGRGDGLGEAEAWRRGLAWSRRRGPAAGEATASGLGEEGVSGPEWIRPQRNWVRRGKSQTLKLGKRWKKLEFGRIESGREEQLLYSTRRF